MPDLLNWFVTDELKGLDGKVVGEEVDAGEDSTHTFDHNTPNDPRNGGLRETMDDRGGANAILSAPSEVQVVEHFQLRKVGLFRLVVHVLAGVDVGNDG